MSCWRAIVYVAIEPWYEHARKGLDALYCGSWLGVMDGPALNATTLRQYKRWERYRSRDYNLSGLSDWEESALASHFAGKRALLVAAAGGGREVVALARRGHVVDAFDCNDRLVTCCKDLVASEGVNARVLCAEPDQVPVLKDAYDGAIIGWGGYMHVPGRSRRVEFLRQLRARLNPGAPLLLSFFERPSSSRRFRWVYNTARIVRTLRRSSEPVELGDVVDGTFDHHFTKDELGEELNDAGFCLIEYQARPHPHAVALSAITAPR